MNQCEACGRDLEHGVLCPGDTLALAERLERLPKLFVELGLYLAPAPRPLGERVTTSPAEPPLPLNEAVLDLRYGGIALVLESWRSDVQAVRGWGEPAIEGSIDRRVMAAARWLGMSLEWIAAEYPAAGDLAREVKELEGNALSIVGAKPDRGRPLGQCVAVVDEETRCGATIRYRDGDTKLVCPWCARVYEAKDFLTLHEMQPGDSAPPTPVGADAAGARPSRA
ncbi:hypothetical protein AB0D57_14995 [Streptomyces sp. NPDC048275]|uniref:hypothetical protein n=1 Tax=Streptomyces sp. NPDC048275 TaxID=3155629 RepID=UPI0033C39EE6